MRVNTDRVEKDQRQSEFRSRRTRLPTRVSLLTGLAPNQVANAPFAFAPYASMYQTPGHALGCQAGAAVRTHGRLQSASAARTSVGTRFLWQARGVQGAPASDRKATSGPRSMQRRLARLARARAHSRRGFRAQVRFARSAPSFSATTRHRPGKLCIIRKHSSWAVQRWQARGATRRRCRETRAQT